MLARHDGRHPTPELSDPCRRAADLLRKLAAAESMITRCRDECAAIDARLAPLVREVFGSFYLSAFVTRSVTSIAGSCQAAAVFSKITESPSLLAILSSTGVACLSRS